MDEEYIASRVGVQVPMLRQLLYKLSLEHVLKYIPCDHATVLFLHHDRLRPKNLNLDPERYELLKNSSMTRMQKMIDYVSEGDVCRSSFLLEYFGQKDSNDCGTCDICRSAKRKTAAHEDTAVMLASYINVEKSGRYSIDDVALRFGTAGSHSAVEYQDILRRLIDDGTVPPPERLD